MKYNLLFDLIKKAGIIEVWDIYKAISKILWPFETILSLQIKLISVKKEKEQSEDYLSEILKSFGWEERKLSPDILDLTEFKAVLKRLNDVDDEDIKEVLNYLETRSFDVEGSMQILEDRKSVV